MRDGRIDDMQRHLKRLEVRLSALESAAPNCPGGGGLTSEASSLTMEQQIAAALQQYPMMSAPVMARQLGTSAGYVRKVKCQIRKHERNRSLRTQAGLSDKIQAVQGLSREDPGTDDLTGDLGSTKKMARERVAFPGRPKAAIIVETAPVYPRRAVLGPGASAGPHTRWALSNGS